MIDQKGGVALALQGGGAHGAFSWGVLDRLLEDGLRISRVCGASSGALTGVMLAQGLVQGGVPGARTALRQLWTRIGRTNGLAPLRNGPLDGWLWGWDMGSNLAMQGMEAAMRLFSPSQLNPFGHNPLRAVIDDLLDRDALRHPSAIALTVAATDIETGAAALWGNETIDTDVLLASTCLPFVFPAIEINGRAYWDGGYSGNPPLAPLMAPAPPERLVLIRAQQARRVGVPTTPTEILNRVNEIACHNVLEAELAALPPTMEVTSYMADRTLAALPISSKLNTDHDFLIDLFEAGRAAARPRGGHGVEHGAKPRRKHAAMHPDLADAPAD